MTQRELDRAVAMATGEYVSEIRRRGFGAFDPFSEELDPEPHGGAPGMIDWDDLERQRQAPFFSLRRRPELQAA